MTARVLIAYASAFGSTRAVAGVIGQAVRDAGGAVDVRNVIDVDSLQPYQATIVGSPIYNGAWLPEAVRFVEDHAAELSRAPVAFFVVCATMREDTPEHRRGAHSFLDPLLLRVPTVQPLAIGLFAGRIEPGNLPWPVRLRMRLTTDLRRGDDRRWQEVRVWATTLAPHLVQAPPAPGAPPGAGSSQG